MILLVFRFDYVAILDNDEIIVPVDHQGWQEMMKDVIKGDQVVGAWNYDNFYFVSTPDNQISALPSSLTMLSSYYRLPDKQGWIRKYFANTSEVKIVEHHAPRVTHLLSISYGP